MSEFPKASASATASTNPAPMYTPNATKKVRIQ